MSVSCLDIRYSVSYNETFTSHRVKNEQDDQKPALVLTDIPDVQEAAETWSGELGETRPGHDLKGMNVTDSGADDTATNSMTKMVGAILSILSMYTSQHTSMC